ncbi:hypothetical protein [Limnoglobus roseus]|uniref:Uncharacterized protein n=1 Tax=Limnoglobus roseus TaxID=2598579 RepID=A0A5C1AKQ5_9BACT|nr:hypothetical protein [Limnoglobus roseus]QEL17744.1 hypothetical protein PX52LOC_04748 [Limnoglobus roseus]
MPITSATRRRKRTTPRYPPPNARDEFYGLTDGIGLWVFGLIWSSVSLPAYMQATAGKKPPSLANGGKSASHVWRDEEV